MIRRDAPRLYALLPLCVAFAARAVAQGIELRSSVAQDLSAPLTLMPPAESAESDEHVEREPRKFRRFPPSAAPAAASTAAGPASVPGVPHLLARPTSQALIATLGAKVFRGLGDGFTSASGAFSVKRHPPDPDGDIGPRHYVQLVNESLAVFDRGGALLYGAVPTNTLWTGFDPNCAKRNDGDAVVLYDLLADRWFITQFAVPPSGPPFYQCIAVSQTSDPTGQYYRYAFAYDAFNDYGKFGVWPDAYYATYNFFADADPSSAYRGAVVCAFDRASMLAGNPASQQCFRLFQLDSATPPALLYGGLLAADLDGALPPPAGAPNPLMSFDGAQNLQLWKFHVDWVDPSRSTLNGSATCTTSAASCAPISIPVDSFNQLCFTAPAANGTCIPQKGVTQQLDSLGDRPMFRLVYRNFGDHESLLLNHSVQAGAGGGVRWYELRDLTGPRGPTLYQQGTFAPDANFRWMGSMAMDAAGNIALAYSLSGTTIYPGISYTARADPDPPGAMTLPETMLQAGAGAQGATPFKGSSRWGDYSNMSIDPLDDCTFWYTTEYMPITGNWSTAIASFQLATCGSFRVTAPSVGAVTRGGSTTLGVSLGTASGSTGTVSLSAAGLPEGVTATFSPPSVPIPGTSTLTLAADASTTQTLRAAPARVVAALQGTTQTRSAALALDVLGNEFGLTAAPQLTRLPAGAARAIDLRTKPVSGAAESIALSTGPLPTGLTAAFNPATVIAGGGSTLTLRGNAALADRQLKLVVRAVAPSSSHDLFLDVQTLLLPVPSLAAPAVGARLTGGVDFSMASSVSPSTTLAKLELLADGQPVAQTSAEGFVRFDTTRLGNGIRQFSVRATDAAAGVGLSEPVAMTVDNPSTGSGGGCKGPGGSPDLAALCLLPVAVWLSRKRLTPFASARKRSATGPV
jgi:hypothetical protein